MSDQEALASVIGSHIDLCLNLYPIKNKRLPIKKCDTCNHKDKVDCYYYKAADEVLSIIPQLDVYEQQVDLDIEISKKYTSSDQSDKLVKDIRENYKNRMQKALEDGK